MNSRVINGNKGGVYVAPATLTVPDQGNNNFGAFEALEDAVLDAATVVNVTGLAASGKTIKAGVIIYGRFTSITTASGSGIAYHV